MRLSILIFQKNAKEKLELRFSHHVWGFDRSSYIGRFDHICSSYKVKRLSWYTTLISEAPSVNVQEFSLTNYRIVLKAPSLQQWFAWTAFFYSENVKQIYFFHMRECVKKDIRAWNLKFPTWIREFRFLRVRVRR